MAEKTTWFCVQTKFLWKSKDDFFLKTRSGSLVESHQVFTWWVYNLKILKEPHYFPELGHIIYNHHHNSVRFRDWFLSYFTSVTRIMCMDTNWVLIGNDEIKIFKQHNVFWYPDPEVITKVKYLQYCVIYRGMYHIT